MLVLARLENEKVRIGDDIEITILSIRGNCVKLGINAPRSVRIDRQEVYDRKRTESASPPPGSSETVSSSPA